MGEAIEHHWEEKGREGKGREGKDGGWGMVDCILRMGYTVHLIHCVGLIVGDLYTPIRDSLLDDGELLSIVVVVVCLDAARDNLKGVCVLIRQRGWFIKGLVCQRTGSSRDRSVRGTGSSRD